MGGLPDEAGGRNGERFLGWSEPREDLIQEGVADDGVEFAGVPDELDDVAQGPVVALRGDSCWSGDRKCLVWISDGLPEESGLCHRNAVRRSHELGEQVVGRRVEEAWAERAGVLDQLDDVPYGDVVDRCGGNLVGDRQMQCLCLLSTQGGPTGVLLLVGDGLALGKLSLCLLSELLAPLAVVWDDRIGLARHLLASLSGTGRRRWGRGLHCFCLGLREGGRRDKYWRW